MKKVKREQFAKPLMRILGNALAQEVTENHTFTGHLAPVGSASFLKAHAEQRERSHVSSPQISAFDSQDPFRTFVSWRRKRPDEFKSVRSFLL